MGSGTPEQRFWRKVRKTRGCWHWTGKAANGDYTKCRFNIGNGRKIHPRRYAYELLVGPEPEGRCNMTCDTPSCVRPDHVRYGLEIPEDRFWRLVRKTRGCWHWTGNVASDGFGRFWLDNQIPIIKSAHRYAYELEIGLIPDGRVLGQACGNPLCVRPDHLESRPNRIIPRKLADRFWEKVDRGPRCWEWQASKMTSGYGQFGMTINGRNRPTNAHRVAYELEYGPIPPGQLVRHKCDNPPCVRPDHLELGTSADNSRDMVNRGRSTRGERSHFAKLTWSEVRKIRAARKRKAPCRAIANEFNVTASTVSDICTERTWRE